MRLGAAEAAFLAERELSPKGLMKLGAAEAAFLAGR
jgi:hypothetical protein